MTPLLTASQPPRKRAIILDRDGTVVRDRCYSMIPDCCNFSREPHKALRQFSERGHPIVVVTNQSGVGHGLLMLERMHEVNERFVRMVEEAGASVDRLYSCPHKPDDDCECRKTKTKPVPDGAAALDFEPAHSVVIGDKSSDIALGHHLQAVTIVVSNDRRARDGEWVEADYIIRDLLHAVRIVTDLEGDARNHGGAGLRG